MRLGRGFSGSVVERGTDSAGGGGKNFKEEVI